MCEISAFIMWHLISSIEDFITKTHVLKDMNILCELKVINDKIDKVIKDQMNSLNSWQIYTQITVQSTWADNACIITAVEQGKRAREIVIKTDSERLNTRDTLTEELLLRIKSVIDRKLAEKALALWCLFSGDLILQTADISIKEALSVNTDWMNHIDINMRIHCRTYSVIVYRVMKDHVDTTDEAAVRKVIEQQNNMLHAELHLQCITWSKRALQTGKKYRLMIVKTASAEKVNALIEKDWIEEQDIKTCELFERECQMTQCFNCQQYEHTDRACKMSIKCRHCTESHDTKVCSHLLDKIKRRCMICMKSGHEAWVNICEACIEQKKRTQIAFFNKSVFYSQQT